MQKVLALTLLFGLNLQLVIATCSSETASACSNGYNDCVMAASNNTDELCNCFGAYAVCLLDNNCIDSTEFQNLVGYCESNYGCAPQQCSGGVVTPVSAPFSAPVASAPVAHRGCDTSVCIDNYGPCLNRSTEGYCPCYGEYLACIFYAGCLSETEYQSAILSCEQMGCSLQQCSLEAPVAPPVDAPIASPVSTPTSTCNADQATFCANDYNVCAAAAGANVSAICSCYGPYFVCLYDFSCISISQYESLIQTCQQSGCTAQQCTGNGITPVAAPIDATPVTMTPVNAPTTSTPLGVPPTSAPLAPPASVICLEPWEVVLIIVGSMLAGIGVAAIVGVIIYFSRRSSNKKSTKYAKLLHY